MPKDQLELYLSQKKRKNSTKMATNKEAMMDMDPKEVFGWDVENLDAGLKELNVTIGTDWVKSRKAYELCKALEEAQMTGDMPNLEAGDSNMMMQMFKMMQDDLRKEQELSLIHI